MSLDVRQLVMYEADRQLDFAVMMVFVVETSEIGKHASRTAVNDTCTLMASVTPGNAITIHQRDHENSAWTQSATWSDAASDILLSGELVEHIAWGHPQFGNIVAAGTTMGRILILSNRPDPWLCKPGNQSAWRVCCTLLQAGNPSLARRIRAVAFAPPVMGLCLGVMHENGVGNIFPCAKPGLPHQASSWPNTYTIRPPAQSGQAFVDHARPNVNGEQCVGLSWQPQMHAQQPFLAVATQSSVSLWCFERTLMDWVCVCSDIESSAQLNESHQAITSVAWAPLMGRDAECIAVSRGSIVRLFSLQGQLQHVTAQENVQVQQVGQDLQHDSMVWKLKWDCLGMHLAVSCKQSLRSKAYVAMWKLRLTGDLGDQPAFVIRANGHKGA